MVFHAAAIRNRWATSAAEYRRANVEGTRRLLDASVGQARRFVYVSSVGVLGWPGVQGIDESFPTDVHSAKVGYHSTKAEAEQVVRARGGEIEAVVARPTITYGPDDADGMVTRLIDMIARGRFLRVGRGDEPRPLDLHRRYDSRLDPDGNASGRGRPDVHPGGAALYRRPRIGRPD